LFGSQGKRILSMGKMFPRVNHRSSPRTFRPFSATSADLL
jgi:hypothetical protein